MQVHPIDLGYLGLDRAASAFLVSPEGGPAFLVECGPAACLARLTAGLEALGSPPASIADLFVTHIHLDHAGAAGHLARGGTRVHVHPFGTKHLVDPAKLIASSRLVHGTSFDRHYAEPLPCPPDAVHAVEDGAAVPVAGATVRAIATPGHARHHHVWVVESDGRRVAFTGDVGAMIVPGSRFVSVPGPPPEFDLAAWRLSLDRLEAAARREAWDELWLTHGGRVDRPVDHLRAARARLEEETAFLVDLLRLGASEAEAVDRYEAWLRPRAVAGGVDIQRLTAFVGPSFCRMNLNGVRRWLAQNEPAAGSGR